MEDTKNFASKISVFAFHRYDFHSKMLVQFPSQSGQPKLNI